MYDLERTSNDDYEWKIKSDRDLMAVKQSLDNLRKANRLKFLTVSLTTGICSLIDHRSDSVVFYIRRHAFCSWDHFSGDISFPVPGKNGQNPGDKYENTAFKWNPFSAYGRLRWDLLRHTIEVFEKEIESYEKETKQAEKAKSGR